MGKEEGSPPPARAASAAVPARGGGDSLLEVPGSAVALQRFRPAVNGAYLRREKR